MRLALLIIAVAAALPATARELTTDDVQRVIIGKTFSFSCFEGTSGVGGVFGDGSAKGSIRLQGNGALQQAKLPAGTLYARGHQFCASIRGLAFEPCFSLVQIDAQRFRGSVRGLAFAYCDFTRQDDHAEPGSQAGARRLEVNRRVN